MWATFPLDPLVIAAYLAPKDGEPHGF